jgi:hypothetical protein
VYNALCADKKVSLIDVTFLLGMKTQTINCIGVRSRFEDSVSTALLRQQTKTNISVKTLKDANQQNNTKK